MPFTCHFIDYIFGPYNHKNNYPGSVWNYNDEAIYGTCKINEEGMDGNCVDNFPPNLCEENTYFKWEKTNKGLCELDLNDKCYSEYCCGPKFCRYQMSYDNKDSGEKKLRQIQGYVFVQFIRFVQKNVFGRIDACDEKSGLYCTNADGENLEIRENIVLKLKSHPDEKKQYFQQEGIIIANHLNSLDQGDAEILSLKDIGICTQDLKQRFADCKVQWFGSQCIPGLRCSSHQINNQIKADRCNINCKCAGKPYIQDRDDYDKNENTHFTDAKNNNVVYKTSEIPLCQKLYQCVYNFKIGSFGDPKFLDDTGKLEKENNNVCSRQVEPTNPEIHDNKCWNIRDFGDAFLKQHYNHKSNH